MPYLTNASVQQTGKGPGTAKVRVHWTFGNLESDMVEVRIPGQGATPAVLLAAVQVDHKNKSPASTEFTVPAPNALVLAVSPRTLNGGGVLTDQMPDDSGQEHYWESFSIQLAPIAVAPDAPVAGARPPAPVVQRTDDIGRRHIGVRWMAGHDYDSYFVNVTEKVLPGRPQKPPVTIHHDDDGTWGYQRVDGLKPDQTYIVQVQGCTERVFGVLDDHCWDWSAPVEFTTLPPAVFAVRPPVAAHVAASQQFGLEDQTDAFVIDGAGAVNVCWVVGAGAWDGPQRITAQGAAPPGGHLIASPQVGVAGQTDVFYIDNSGALNVLWVSGGGNWNGPVRLTAPQSTPAGAALAASEQYGLQQTDVFFVDHAGAVNVMWVVGGGAWNGPVRISPPGFAPPGAHMAASPQFGVANQTDVFVIDSAGALNVLWVQGAGAWSGPVRISPPGIAPAGAPLAASRQFGLDQTDVFFVDLAGAVNVSWAAGGGVWSGPARISAQQFAPPGAAIVASPQFGIGAQTDVFLVDNSGAINVLWVVGAGTWNNPVRISPAGFAAPGSPLMASAQHGLDQTDVLVVDHARAVSVMWVVGGGAWSGPVAVHA